VTNIQNLPLLSLSITIPNNGDFLDSFIFTDVDDVTPLDISGIDFTCQVRASSSSSGVRLNASTANGLLVIIGTTQLGFSVPAAQLPSPGGYVFDIVATADGLRRVVAQATLIITQGVTAIQ